MVIKQSKWKLGVPMIIIGLLFFIGGYMLLLVQVIQKLYVERNLLNGLSKQPPLIPYMMFAMVDGFLLGCFLYFGYTLSTLQDEPKNSLYKPTFNDLFKSAGFFFTLIACVAGMIGLTIWWRSDI